MWLYWDSCASWLAFVNSARCVIFFKIIILVKGRKLEEEMFNFLNGVIIIFKIELILLCLDAYI